MIWVAFDRAVRAMEDYDLAGPLEEWRALRDQVRDEVLEHGYDAERGTFVQHYGTTEVDASLLILPLVGFVDGDDPRMLGTIAAVEEDLLRDGLVLRYRTQTGVDGLAGDEHPFVACSFWLVSAYAAAGRVDDAHALFDRLVGLRNDVGLLSEEYDPVRQRMVGNFPQAFSHLALVQAAFHLADADAERPQTRAAASTRLERDRGPGAAVATPGPCGRFRSGDRELHLGPCCPRRSCCRGRSPSPCACPGELAEVERQLAVLQGLGEVSPSTLILHLAGGLDAVGARRPSTISLTFCLRGRVRSASRRPRRRGRLAHGDRERVGARPRLASPQ